MNALIYLVAGIVVTILSIFSTVANSLARVTPPPIARHFWHAGLVAEHPDLTNPHAKQWAKQTMLSDLSMTSRFRAATVWLQQANVDNPDDLEFAYQLIELPPTARGFEQRTRGVDFLIDRLKAGHFDEKTFATAERLADRGGELGGYEAARILARMDAPQWKDRATNLLKEIADHGRNTDSRHEAEDALAFLSGHPRRHSNL